MKKYLVLLITVSLLSFSVAHKYYVALTEIEYDEKQQSVQMIMNVFMDDIELALNNAYTIDSKIAHKNEIKGLNNYFNQYLNEHFKVFINGEKKNYKFVGKEFEGDIVYFYLEIENIIDVKELKIENTILLKDFPEQQNLVKATIKGNRKSLFLTKKNDKGLLKF